MVNCKECGAPMDRQVVNTSGVIIIQYYCHNCGSIYNRSIPEDALPLIKVK